jgi:hypothetical protein
MKQHFSQKGERIMFKPKRDHLLLGAAFVAVVVILFELVGCSQVPTKSAEQSQPTLLKRNLSAYKLTDASAYVDTVFAAAQGGTLRLIDVELTFPPNALPADTAVFIEIPDLSVFENHFGTDGLRFNVPVKVVMSYRDADLSGIDESTITLAWLNEVTGEWNSMNCVVDFENKTVTGFVEHFSAYALISDNR